jgi:hypothetical protein
MERRPLFGGAVSMSTEMTADWLDASDVRPVPDHQEVWTERAGGADRSLVVELNDALPGSDIAAAREHFEELCNADACLGGQLLDFAPLATAGGAGDSAAVAVTPAPAVALSAVQLRADGARVLVSLVLIRLRAQATDLLVTVYRPLPASHAAEVSASPEGADADAAVAAHVRSTLLVHDWGLFVT